MSELQSHHSMFEEIKWINHTRTAVYDHPQLSLKCRLPNPISFDVFDRCFCKVATWVCETLFSCAERLGGLALIQSGPAHIYGCYSPRTSRSWWIAHSTQLQPRGCNSEFCN